MVLVQGAGAGAGAGLGLVLGWSTNSGPTRTVILKGQKIVDEDAIILEEGQKVVDFNAIVLEEGQIVPENNQIVDEIPVIQDVTVRDHKLRLLIVTLQVRDLIHGNSFVDSQLVVQESVKN